MLVIYLFKSDHSNPEQLNMFLYTPFHIEIANWTLTKCNKVGNNFRNKRKNCQILHYVTEQCISLSTSQITKMDDNAGSWNDDYYLFLLVPNGDYGFIYYSLGILRCTSLRSSENISFFPLFHSISCPFLTKYLSHRHMRRIFFPRIKLQVTLILSAYLTIIWTHILLKNPA